MIAAEGHVSRGFTAGLTVTIVLAVICLAVVAWGLVYSRTAAYDAVDGWWLVGVGAVGLLITVAAAAIAFYPYDMQYHRYKPVTGTVEESTARMLASGDGGSTQQFAVRFVGSPQVYRCDDTRCALVKPGDRLSLNCIRDYEYASTSGWRCRFVGSVPAGRPS